MAFESYLPHRAIEEMLAEVKDRTYGLPMEGEDLSAVIQSLSLAWRLSVLPPDVLTKVGELLTRIANMLDVDIEKLREEELAYLNGKAEEK